MAGVQESLAKEVVFVDVVMVGLLYMVYMDGCCINLHSCQG